MKMQSLTATILAAAAYAVPASAYTGSPNPSAADATAVYLFDGNLNDSTSNGRSLRGEAGAITYTTGLHAQAFNSNLPNNHPATMLGLVDHGSDSGVIANTSSFAVELAVNVQQNVSQCYLGANSVPGWGGNNRVFALRGNADPTDSSKIYFEFGVQDAGGNLLTASSPSVPFSSVQNTWVTIAGRSTGSTLELYVNGALANTTNSAGANADFLANQTVIRIGTDWGGGNGAYALIDDVAIYNTPRTDFQGTVVPEPATLALTSLLGVGMLARRRRA